MLVPNMSVSCGQRVAVSRVQAGRLRVAVSKLPTTLRQTIVHPSNGFVSRNLWWWSRRHDWSIDEDMEERFLRHQRVARNKYSKLLWRRSIWEGDEHARNPAWARSRRWLVTRWADKKALSYQRALQASMHEPGKRSDDERPWKEWDRDFDRLKARIDEQIERDPYGALFGRQLRGPPSANNSSWTSFSWIYGPLKSMQRDISSMSPDGTPDPIANTTPASKSTERTMFSVPPRTPSSAQSSRSSPTEQEYEFDPISMRRLPKRRETSPNSVPPVVTAPSEPKPKKAFLKTLFSEPGTEIEVKIYKPHRVYGYKGSEASAVKGNKSEIASKAKPSGINLESSRLRDLQALKFRTLGNSIDTTAEYGGKYHNPADPEPIHITAAKTEQRRSEEEEALKKHDVKDVLGEDNATLFAGTTYEGKAKEIASVTMSNPSLETPWLEKEGFQTSPQTLAESETDTNHPAASREIESLQKPLKVEPALDRVKASDVRRRKVQEATARKELVVPDNKAEDVDLLRASDIRAGTRSARKTRHEVNKEKQETRRKLEIDYSKHQLLGAAKFAINAESTKDRFSRRLSSVWEHVKKYPQGIVAKTVDSMGIFNDNYKKYARLDKPMIGSNEKLVFRDENLSKTPSIYQKVSRSSAKPLQTFTPSQEVVDVEKAEQARLAFVKRVNEDTKKKASVETKQAEALASDIRNAYEEHYGKIDVNHRQGVTTANIGDKPMPSLQDHETIPTDLKKPVAALRPMGLATVKPGVEENPVIKDHVSVFEPRFAKLIDEAKAVRRVIHEAKREVMALKSRQPQTSQSVSSTDATSSSMPRAESARIEPALNRSKEKQASETSSKSIEPPAITMHTADYIILAYDASSNTVTTSPLDSSMPLAQDSAASTSVPQILASLNHTAKFLSHFAGLSKQGYEVVSGGDDVLIFKKRGTKIAEPSQSPLRTHIRTIIEKNKLAAQEASSRTATGAIPVKTDTSPPKELVTPAKEAATVLDELPASEPNPGPAGPTAPPMGSPSFMTPKVRRQEDVFSASRTSRASPPPAASATKDSFEEATTEVRPRREGLWARFTRVVRRVVLTAAAMGVGAYTIGAVAESLGAQQHPEKVIRGRPGIYSTESSR